MSKQFVKAKPLQVPKDRGGGKEYQPKEPRKNAKKYEEKEKVLQKDPRQGIKMMLDAYKAIKSGNKSQLANDLITKYPKLFIQVEQKPEKDGTFNFNDCLRLGPKKQPFIKQSKPLSSDSSEPDWDSDCEKEVKLESKKIDDEIIKKVEEQLKAKAPKKIDELQRHEKQFLEDYYRHKKAEEGSDDENDTINKSEPMKNAEICEQKVEATVWNEYNPQVDALISGGFLQKIDNTNDDDGDDDFQIDEDFAWNEEVDTEEQKKQQSSSSSEEMDGDDIFADDKPRTIKQKKDSNTQKTDEHKGIVYINDHLFSIIAEKIGLHPDACTWVISNKTDRYKVSTQYMNAFYKQKELFKAFPYVSLNHSLFVPSEEIETEKGMQKFKRFNQRKRYQRNTGIKQNQNRGKKEQHLYKPKK